METQGSVRPVAALGGPALALIGTGVALAHSETLAPEKALALCNAGGLFLVLALFAACRVVLQRAGQGAGFVAFVAVSAALALLAATSPLAQLPWINDISTDLDSPPAISVPRAGAPADEPYLPSDFLPLIRAAYPDLKPVTIARPPADVLKAAEGALKSLAGFGEVRVDAARGLVHAVQVTPLMRFRDDVTVRVQADGTGSRVDVRSRSRVGKSDLGANAKRIRQVLEVLPR